MTMATGDTRESMVACDVAGSKLSKLASQHVFPREDALLWVHATSVSICIFIAA